MNRSEFNVFPFLIFNLLVCIGKMSVLLTTVCLLERAGYYLILPFYGPQGSKG